MGQIKICRGQMLCVSQGVARAWLFVRDDRYQAVAYTIRLKTAQIRPLVGVMNNILVGRCTRGHTHYTQTYTQTYMHAYCTYIHTVHTYTHTYIHTYTHTYIQTHTNTHTRTHTHTHIHTYLHT